MRCFNVFPFFLCRLSKAYKPASKYMNLFVSPFMAIIAKYVFLLILSISFTKTNVSFFQAIIHKYLELNINIVNKESQLTGSKPVGHLIIVAGIELGATLKQIQVMFGSRTRNLLTVCQTHWPPPF